MYLNEVVICFNRVAREGKERRRKWAQRITPRPSKVVEGVADEPQPETNQQSMANIGMLPDDIVQLLAAREK